MKTKYILSMLIVGFAFFVQAQNVGINTTGATPHPSAMLDVSSTDKGFLPPRMTSAERMALPTPLPANGLVVFDTDTQSLWIIQNGVWVNQAASWNLNGNGGTTTTNFIGTTDYKDLVFKVNNFRSGIIKADGTLTSFGTNSLSNNTGTDIIAIGSNIMPNNQGSSNIGIGTLSLNQNSLGNFNVALGTSALMENKTGDRNTAVGYLAMRDNIDGIDNVAVGGSALTKNQSGNINTAIGVNALYENTSGSYNLATGYQCLWKNTTGYNNVAYGIRALQDNTIGANNIAIGNFALEKNIIKNGLVAIGDSSLFFNGTNASTPTQSTENTAIGNRTLTRNTIGSSNTAFGSLSLTANTIGDENTAIGANSLLSNKFGNNNTAIGSQALRSSLGTGNVAIGNNAGYSETGSDKLYIDNSATARPLIYGDFDDNYMEVNGQLRVHNPNVVENYLQITNGNNYNHFVGAQNFGSGAHQFMLSSADYSDENSGVYGDGNAVTIWSPGDSNGGQPDALVYFADEDLFNNADTNPYNNGALKSYIDPVGAYVQVSDRNKKENIKPIYNSLAIIKQISGYTYQFKLAPEEIAKGDNQKSCSGVLAQELENIFPQAIQKSTAGDYFVDYAAITPLLLQGIKEQQTLIDALKSENQKISNSVENYKNDVEDLKKKFALLEKENLESKKQMEAISLLLIQVAVKELKPDANE